MNRVNPRRKILNQKFIFLAADNFASEYFPAEDIIDCNAHRLGIRQIDRHGISGDGVGVEGELKFRWRIFYGRFYDGDAMKRRFPAYSAERRIDVGIPNDGGSIDCRL